MRREPQKGREGGRVKTSMFIVHSVFFTFFRFPLREKYQREKPPLTLFSCDFAVPPASFALRSRFCCALAPLPIVVGFVQKRQGVCFLGLCFEETRNLVIGWRFKWLMMLIILIVKFICAG